MAHAKTLKLICLLTALGGCASNLPLRMVNSNASDTLITDASAVMTVTRRRTEGLVTCSRMNADVSVDRESSLSVSTLNFGNEGESNGEQETELQGRTPGLLAMRDALYHSCLLYQSGAITSDELLNMTSSIMDRSYDVLEIEAENSRWVFNEQAKFGGASPKVQPVGSVPASATTTGSNTALTVPSSTTTVSPSSVPSTSSTTSSTTPSTVPGSTSSASPSASSDNDFFSSFD